MINGKTTGKKIVIDVIEKKQLIHLPDNVKSGVKTVDLFVVAIGPEVEVCAVGDEVLCPPPEDYRQYKIDLGDGEKTYLFYDEEDIEFVFTNTKGAE